MSTAPTGSKSAVTAHPQMRDAGNSGPDDRIELIDGEQIRQTPISQDHHGTTNRLT